MSAIKKTICIDFDGVVHSYTSPWVGPEIIEDAPVAGAFEFISECLRVGLEVAIFSSRSRTQQGRAAMQQWLTRNGFGLTHHLLFPEHKPAAVIYIDDRGFHFTGKFPSMEFIQSFEPWNRPTPTYLPARKRFGLGRNMKPWSIPPRQLPKC